MLAIVLGMLIVLCGVLFFRLHAFLALFFAALVVAAATSSSAIQQSVLQNATALITEVSANRLVLVNVGKSFGAKPGEYVLFRDANDNRGGTVAIRVTIERFEAEEETTTAYLPEDSLLSVEPQGARLAPQGKYEQAVELSEDQAINRVASALGTTFGKLGILIAMASIIGQCLIASGAAERIVQTIRSLMGERWTALAFVISSFVLAIPVFFDTVFFLMLPLAKAMARRTGRDYLLYVMSIIVGGTLAHSLVPPTPGPLFVAEQLDVSIGEMVIGGIGVGFWGVLAGYFYMVWANRRWVIPLRDSEENTATNGPADSSESNERLPSFSISILPVIIPVLLLGWKTLHDAEGVDSDSSLFVLWDATISFLGDKNIALSLGALLAMLTLVGKPDTTWTGLAKSVQKALSDGGVVLLITCAGGAFGEMIRQTNIGTTIADALPTSAGGAGLLVTAFLITMIIRVIQGSATVAMITAIGIVVPVASQMGLPYHPVYLALAIGCGSKPLPWMNDSGFWVIGRMSGFTEKETLKTFSVLLTIMGLVSFLATLVSAMLLPLAQTVNPS